MKYLKTIGKVLAAVAEPLRLNCAFAVFMYMLGCITAWATLPDARGAHLYDNLYLELFLDVYVLTLILTVLPRKVMIWRYLSRGVHGAAVRRYAAIST